MVNKIKDLRFKNQDLHKVLQEIVEKKKQDLVVQKKEIPLSKLKEFTSNLLGARNLFKENLLKTQEIAIIAEIKLASPADLTFDPKVEIMDQAGIYEKAGADAISYITEKYFFKGDVSKVIRIAAKVKLPILQKDFVIDEYQIYEAKIVGSDGLLLIARLISKKTLKRFVAICLKLGIEPVVEINDEKDLKKALASSTKIIAINARDLSTFNIDIESACDLMKKIPDNFIKLGFSGISSCLEVTKYKKAGARGVLVGTSLMKAKNIKDFINSLKI